jgi:hypothetical protein
VAARRYLPWIAVVCATALGVASLWSCLDPTEVTLVISTNLPCTAVTQSGGVAISVGPPGDDSVSPSAVAKSCSDDGGVGTLVVVPNGDPKAQLGIRVVVGVDASTSSCDQTNYAGCIVARRSLYYVPHQPLTMPIYLDQACVSVHCDPNSTCQNGQCVPAETTCTNSICSVTGDGGPPDAGPPDASDGGPTCVTSQASVAVSKTALAPRVAKTTAGYVVAWFDSVTSQAEMQSFYLVPPNALPFANAVYVPPMNNAAILGPLGTDGVNHSLLLQGGAPLTTAYVQTPDGGVAAAHTFSDYAPLEGVYADPDAGGFVSAFVAPTPSASILASWAPDGQFSMGASVGTGFDQVSLSRFGSTYSLTTHTSNHACSVYTCTSYAVCGAAPLAKFNIGAGCYGAKFVQNGTAQVLAWTSFGDGGSYLLNVSGVTSPISEIDGANEFLALPVNGSQVRLLWVVAGSLKTAVVDASLQVSAVDTLVASGIRPVSMPFGGTSDDPTQPGYAVVYWWVPGTTQTLSFAHYCN